MKKFLVIFCVLSLVFGLGITSVYAGAEDDARKCSNGRDDDKDGLIDCDDNDCDPFCGACIPSTEVCTGGVDEDCDGDIDCADADCTDDPACTTCTPSTEICTGGVDEDCDGDIDCADADCTSDPACTSGPENCIDGIDNDNDGKTDCADTDCTTEPSCVNPNHSGINSYDGPQTCIGCHSQAGNQMLNSVHGAWSGPTPNVSNINASTGKWGQSNNYCTDAEMADYACLKCHVSLVAPVVQGKVDMSVSNLTAADMDCMQCHQANYAATFMPDPATATDYTSCVDGSTHTYVVPTPEADGKIHKVIRFDLLDPPANEIELARTVHLPNNATCLMPCHAKAGGGDGTKRGDLSSDMVDPPVSIDVHLSSSGTAQLTCSSCHVATNHQIPGRGNDLRPEDTGATMKNCVDCHAGFDGGGAHAAAGARVEPDRHVARVDCTGCHIDVYGKGVGTEVSRDWTAPWWNAGGCEGQGAYVGHEVRGTDLTPEYRFWNKTSWVYDRDGTEGLMTDPVDGGLAMSYPNGGIMDGKLYPFKIHTSVNPVNDSSSKTNFDVLQMFMTGCYDNAAVDGLAYAGETGSYTWTENKAYQLITHGVAPAANADDCEKCHHARKEFDVGIVTKLDKIGYALKDADKNGAVDAADAAIICSQCHDEKAFKSTWEQMHAHTGKGTGGIGCIFCHDFERPERGLCNPCTNPGCETEYVDTNPYDHCTP